MIQCKFGKKSRQASLLRHKGFWPVLSFLSKLFLSVFLVALVFCPSYLIISHISISLMGKKSQAVKVLPHLWWVCNGWWFSRVARNIGSKSQQTSNFCNTLPRAIDFDQSLSFLCHLYLSASQVFPSEQVLPSSQNSRSLQILLVQPGTPLGRQRQLLQPSWLQESPTCLETPSRFTLHPPDPEDWGLALTVTASVPKRTAAVNFLKCISVPSSSSLAFRSKPVCLFACWRPWPDWRWTENSGFMRESSSIQEPPNNGWEIQRSGDAYPFIEVASVESWKAWKPEIALHVPWPRKVCFFWTDLDLERCSYSKKFNEGHQIPVQKFRKISKFPTWKNTEDL